MLPEFVGEWHLDGYALVDTFIGASDPSDLSAVQNWLLAAAGAGWPEVEARTGLVLVIRRDGTYSERAPGEKLSMLWYDSDGVQTASPEPTEGVVRGVGGRPVVSLHPHTPPARADFPGGDFRGVLRYDDGDTLVSDILRLEGNSLIRAISVVTDDLYFNRVVSRYWRSRA
jgi:hypothetical protein